MVGAAAFAALAFSLHRVPQDQAAQPSITSCALADSAYTSARAFPGFVRFLDYQFDSLPRTRGPNTIVRARQVGALTSAAISGPFRAQLDYVARAHGYAIGRFPLTPLSGPIVIAIPSPLEEYETHLVFTDRAAANEWFAGRRNNGSGIAGVHDVPFPIAVGDESFGLRASDGNPQHETLIYIAFRVGRVGVQLDVLGGRAVSGEQTATLASIVAKYLEHTCA